MVWQVVMAVYQMHRAARLDLVRPHNYIIATTLTIHNFTTF